MSTDPDTPRIPEVAPSAAASSDGAARAASSVDRVQAAVRERILSGVYPPGSRLILSRLAAEHGVSFIPIREGLQRLESERLVETEPNRGARVAEISIADMRDIYETRVVLEQHAVRTAIPKLTDEDLKAAGDALDRMEERFAADRQAEAYQAHQRFHFALYEPAGSAWTMHVIRLLWASAERYVRLAAAVRPKPEVFVAEHREIFDAVVSGDVEAAVESLIANLRTTEKLLAENYESVPHRVDRA
jgi:DNA-binding GntR family transcriptional regulator